MGTGVCKRRWVAVSTEKSDGRYYLVQHDGGYREPVFDIPFDKLGQYTPQKLRPVGGFSHVISGLYRPSELDQGVINTRSGSTERDGDLVQRGRGNLCFGVAAEQNRNNQGGEGQSLRNILLLWRLDDHEHHKASRRHCIDRQGTAQNPLFLQLKMQN